MRAIKTVKRRLDAFLMLLRYARLSERPELLVALVWHAFAISAHKDCMRRRIVTLGGFRLSIIPGRMSGLTFFVEVIVRDLYKKLSAETLPGNERLVILDAGANVGCFSLWAARRWPQALIVAVEPQPQAYQDLIQNIIANGLVGRVIPLQKAISNVAGPQVMHTHTLHNMATLGSYDASDPSGVATETMIDCVSIDEIEETQAVRFAIIKMDIEGGEVMAFCGAGKSLGHVRQVIVETHSAVLDRECRAILEQNGLVTSESHGLLYARRSP